MTAVNADAPHSVRIDVDDVLNVVRRTVLTVIYRDFIEVAKLAQNERLVVLKKHVPLEAVHDFMAKLQRLHERFGRLPGVDISHRPVVLQPKQQGSSFRAKR